MTALDGVTARDDKDMVLTVTESERRDALSITLTNPDMKHFDFHLSRYYALQVRDRLTRFLETDYVKGAWSARELLRGAKLAHKMIYGIDVIDVTQFGEHVLDVRKSGHWIVTASDDYKAGFNAEVEKIYRELREADPAKHVAG